MNKDISRFQRRYNIDRVVDHNGYEVRDGQMDVGLWVLSKAVFDAFVADAVDKVGFSAPDPQTQVTWLARSVRVVWEDTDVPARVLPRGSLVDAWFKDHGARI